MENRIKTNAQLSKGKTVENPPGIFRTTLAYNGETMLCHFRMKEGSSIPLHNHPAVQNGFVIRGKLRFIKKDKAGFIAETGSGYVFASNEPHGAEVLEYSEVIECFAPVRPEYIDD
ncbi:MAG TPA: cupin domain-containing protein [Spirochaetia bacterium]|nr:cupin domain-containing protein [Spirochaetia bacterium]